MGLAEFKPKPQLEHRSFTKPDETRTFKLGKVELITLGGVTFGRATFEPGWRWSECIKPIAQTQSCEMPHLSYVLRGRMHVAMDDGTAYEFGPGELAEVPPGHDGWVVGNEPCVMLDITGMENYAKTKKSA